MDWSSGQGIHRCVAHLPQAPPGSHALSRLCPPALEALVFIKQAAAWSLHQALSLPDPLASVPAAFP